MPTSSEPLLVHNVYFALHDKSPAARQKLIDDCNKYLTGHPGTVLFAVGTVSDLDRPVGLRLPLASLHLFPTNAI